MLQVKSFTFNILGANCYVIWEEGQQHCVIVDPGMYRDFEETAMTDFLSAEGLTPDGILLTHGHFDHTWGVSLLVARYGCPVYMSDADRETARMGASFFHQLSFMKQPKTFSYQDISDGQVLSLGGTKWTVISCPGHSPGCVSYYAADEGILLTGDTLFAGAIGRTDLEGGDYDALMKSLLEKLMVLPGDTDVLPGHGERSSIAVESANNPFLLPFNESPQEAWRKEDGLSLHRT